jgi:hypothetical protein
MNLKKSTVNSIGAQMNLKNFFEKSYHKLIIKLVQTHQLL